MKLNSSLIKRPNPPIITPHTAFKINNRAIPILLLSIIIITILLTPIKDIPHLQLFINLFLPSIRVHPPVSKLVFAFPSVMGVWLLAHLYELVGLLEVDEGEDSGEGWGVD